MAYSDTYHNNEEYRTFLKNKAANIINVITLFEGTFNPDGSNKLTPEQRDQYIGSRVETAAIITSSGVTSEVYTDDLHEELRNQKAEKNWVHHDTRTPEGKAAAMAEIQAWENTKNA